MQDDVEILNRVREKVGVNQGLAVDLAAVHDDAILGLLRFSKEVSTTTVRSGQFTY